MESKLLYIIFACQITQALKPNFANRDSDHNMYFFTGKCAEPTSMAEPENGTGVSAATSIRYNPYSCRKKEDFFSFCSINAN